MRIIFFIFFISIISNNCFSKNIFETNLSILNFKSNNISLVKNEKIDQIKIKSFNSILEKILTDEYLNKFNLNDISFINEFILNIKINNEKIINDNYYSEIKINFNENLIIKYFNKNQIPYVDHLPEKFLIVILNQNNIKINFLSKENKFYKYLLDPNNKTINNYFIIPNLDFNDRFILNESHILNNNFIQNENLNNKYNVNYQILIHSVEDNGFYKIKTYLINKKNSYLIYDIESKDLNLNNFFITINKKALNQWKLINLINNSIVNNLECKINVNNINELSHVRFLLKNNRIIKSLNLKSIQLNENIYQLNYYGSLSIFQDSLFKSRLKLSFNENSCYIKII